MAQDQIRFLNTRLSLISEVDDMVESAMRSNASMTQAMPRMVQLLLETTDGEAALLMVDDESGEHRKFLAGPWRSFEDLDLTTLAERLRSEASLQEDGLYGYRLDVADKSLGYVLLKAGASSYAPDELGQLLETWAEVVDNHVAQIYAASRKQRAIKAISDAIKQPVIEDAVSQALSVVEHYVPWEDLVVVFQSSDLLGQRNLTYRIVVDGILKFDSSDRGDGKIEEALFSLLENKDLAGAFKSLSFDAPYRSDVPIYGLSDDICIGRVIVGNRHQPLTPFDEDIVDRFADYVRQRAVDFNKEYKQLSRHFHRSHVRRLFQDKDYETRWLAPREQDVCVLFSDITGFTNICEQQLASPQLIAELIQDWSREVVECIWTHGGVFDKMIGDCVIALWGPPFFEEGDQKNCERALACADQLHQISAEVSARFPQLSEPIQLATGINLCSLFIGRFGPGDDYTGFSSGMNNTARLQAHAAPGEILCMESAVRAIGNPSIFGPKKSFSAKNVRDPLSYRSLRRKEYQRA